MGRTGHRRTGYYDNFGHCVLESVQETNKISQRKLTVGVRCPHQPPPTWLPKAVRRIIVNSKSPKYACTIIPDNTNPNLDCYESKHLDDMPLRKIEIDSYQIPLELRCRHLTDWAQHECMKGCYVLERGGEHHRFKCGNKKCRGHVYTSPILKDEDGVSCFGPSRRRMVCIDLP